MDGGTIFILVVVAGLLLFMIWLRWYTKPGRPYSAREMKHVQEAVAEMESRPKPPWADDPIARSIEWNGTAAFGSEPNVNPKGAAVRLSTSSAERLEFQPRSAWKFHVWMLFFSSVGYVLAFISTGSFTNALLAPLACMGLSVVVWLVRALNWETLVFDKRLGMYWLGQAQPPALAAGSASSERLGRIADIHALQLISTRRYTGNPRLGAETRTREYPTCELVLVLRDSTRLSLICLDDYDGVEHDGKLLAAFLQRPLWKPR